MSQVIPIGICKLSDTNQDEVENSVKIIEKRKATIQSRVQVLKSEVNSFHHDIFVLEKEINCMESYNHKLKMEISELKTQTEDLACCLESTKWQFDKASMLKEFEIQTNKEVEKQKFKYEQLVSQETHIDNFEGVQCLKNSDNNGMKVLKEKAKELMQEIDKKNKVKEKVDSNLHVDIQILKKRNAALIVRYQRQIQETESRYRQTLTELNSLQKLLLEKKTLLTSI